MLIVGLTGNIGAGKSEVARLLVAKGATLIDADLLARDAVAPGTAALRAIAARWGSQVLTSEGALDRAAMRRIAFGDPAERRALDAIVHPEVARLRNRAVDRARAAGATIVVCDIPLLFEAQLESTVDTIVLVEAPDAIRRERIQRHRALTAAEADAMIAAQMPSEEKRPRADHLIDNGRDLTALDAQVDALWPQLLARAARSPT